MLISFIFEFIIGLFEAETDISQLRSDFLEFVLEVFDVCDFPFELNIEHFDIFILSVVFLLCEEKNVFDGLKVFEFVGHLETRLPDLFLRITDLLNFPLFIFLKFSHQHPDIMAVILKDSVVLGEFFLSLLELEY